MTSPKILVSSVVRGSQQGESHGGLYLVEIAARRLEQVLDWNTSEISFEGRGADRGLRGLAVVGDLVYVAASDEIYMLNRRFEIVQSLRNSYLNHCHELCVHGGYLYVASTGFNAALRLDLRTHTFDAGVYLASGPAGLSAKWFDPQTPTGPAPNLSLHINNVFADDTGLYISGRKMNALLRLRGPKLDIAARIPAGTHNARPYAGGLLFNDTESDRLVFQKGDAAIAIAVPRYDESLLESRGLDEAGLARQAFGRGLCVLSSGLIAGGSSPTTVAIYDLQARSIVEQMNISMDVRNAAHGLVEWL